MMRVNERLPDNSVFWGDVESDLIDLLGEADVIDVCKMLGIRLGYSAIKVSSIELYNALMKKTTYFGLRKDAIDKYFKKKKYATEFLMKNYLRKWKTEATETVLWGVLEKGMKKHLSSTDMDELREGLGYPHADEEIDTMDAYDILDNLVQSSDTFQQIEKWFDMKGLVYEEYSKYAKKAFKAQSENREEMRWYDLVESLKRVVPPFFISELENILGKPSKLQVMEKDMVFKNLLELVTSSKLRKKVFEFFTNSDCRV
jgi:hypothetical protein